MEFIKKLLGVRKNIDLQKEGGFEKKYYKLIEKLYSLSREEIVDPHKMDLVEMNYNYNSKLLSTDKYVFRIQYIRPGHTMKDLDTFILFHKKNKLIVFYERKSENLLPIDLGNFPKEVKFKFEFNNTLNQENTFYELIEKIQNNFREKYNFSDSSYAKLLSNIK